MNRMEQHLIIDAVHAERATLRDKDGDHFEIPVAWLPRGAGEGTALIVEVTSHDASARFTVRVVEGVSEPAGTDVGA